MKKEVIDFELNYRFDWSEGIEIEKIKEDIKELEKLGATHIEITSHAEYDSHYVDFKGICKRIETDEEFEQRKKESRQRNERIKEMELKKLEELKLKYEK